MDEVQTTAREKGQVNRLESLGSRSEGAPKMPFLKQQKPPRRLEGRRTLNNGAAIQLDRITPDPNQPRKEFDPEALRQLAESIKERQLQPINVRWDESLELYVIISGERRYRACQLAELSTIDCMVVDGELTERHPSHTTYRELLTRRFKTFGAGKRLSGADAAQRMEFQGVGPIA
jgi:ParB family chromosome partitioning protein